MHRETWFSISNIHLRKRNESGLSNEVCAFAGSLVMCRRGGAALAPAPAPASNVQCLSMV